MTYNSVVHNLSLADFEKRIILFENKTCLISANLIPSYSEAILKLLLVNFSNF